MVLLTTLELGGKKKFDKNGPAAIAKYEAKCLAMSEAENNQNRKSESILQDL